MVIIIAGSAGVTGVAFVCLIGLWCMCRANRAAGGGSRRNNKVGTFSGSSRKKSQTLQGMELSSLNAISMDPSSMTSPRGPHVKSPRLVQPPALSNNVPSINSANMGAPPVRTSNRPHALDRFGSSASLVQSSDDDHLKLKADNVRPPAYKNTNFSCRSSEGDDTSPKKPGNMRRQDTFADERRSSRASSGMLSEGPGRSGGRPGSPLSERLQPSSERKKGKSPLTTTTIGPSGTETYRERGDFYEVTFSKEGSLGMKLMDATNGQSGTLVGDVVPDSMASSLAVMSGSKLVKVNGKDVEGKPRDAVARLLATSGRPLTIEFYCSDAMAAAWPKMRDEYAKASKERQQSSKALAAPQQGLVQKAQMVAKKLGLPEDLPPAEIIMHANMTLGLPQQGTLPEQVNKLHNELGLKLL